MNAGQIVSRHVTASGTEEAPSAALNAALLAWSDVSIRPSVENGSGPKRNRTTQLDDEQNGRFVEQSITTAKGLGVTFAAVNA